MEHTVAAEERGDPRAEEVALLVRVCCAPTPLSPAVLLCDLQLFDELRLGRADDDVDRLEPLDAQTSALYCADPCLSRHHARITRQVLGGRVRYVLGDLGSTNGCLVNGRAARSRRLRSGDVLETGQTFWRFFQGGLRAPHELIALSYCAGEPVAGASASMAMLAARRDAQSALQRGLPVTLVGEPGSGRAELARQLRQAFPGAALHLAGPTAARQGPGAGAAGVEVQVPPLRERKEDLGLLMTHCAQQAGAAAPPRGFSLEALRALVLFEWPGNLPQLEARLLAALAACGGGGPLSLQHLEEDVRRGAEGGLQEVASSPDLQISWTRDDGRGPPG